MILGISANYHDSAIALITENKILFAAQEERFTRIKGDSSFPAKAIAAMTKELNISIEDISKIAYYEDPKLKRHRILKTFRGNFPKNYKQIYDFIYHFEPERFYADYHLLKLFPTKQITFHDHHKSHAASSFYCSQFTESAILVIDGVGEWACTSIYFGKGNEIKLLHQDRFPHSIGLLYATFTSYCGFLVNSGEYKLMGLAPYGIPKFVDLITNNLFDISTDGHFTLKGEYFGYTHGKRMWDRKLENLLGIEPRQPESEINQDICDLAASIQVVLEKIVISKIRLAMSLTGSRRICLAGGVALNCVANSKILNILPASSIFIQPAAGDAGGALGAAILSRVKDINLADQNIRFVLNDVFLGTSYDKKSIKELLEKHNLKYHEFSEEELPKYAAKLLVDGASIGWFKGRMEFGPRSLGARSIIANATLPDTQKKLNLQIKKRESFRPFAPVILKSEVHKWFNWEANIDSKFMLFVADVLAEHRTITDSCSGETSRLFSRINDIRSVVPAITHLDYTARLQTVDETNYLFGVLKRYYEISGIPILVNTSFNVRNEPIVESPFDALRCFLTTEIDALVIENLVLLKTNQDLSILDKWKNEIFIGTLD